MSKTLRVGNETYAIVMDLVGQMQTKYKKKVSVDFALKETIGKRKFEKDPKAWEKLEKNMFKGPKTNCVEEIDLLQ